jgi:hypothetical protein
VTLRELLAMLWLRYGRSVLWFVLAVSTTAGTVGYACLRSELAADRADATAP